MKSFLHNSDIVLGSRLERRLSEKSFTILRMTVDMTMKMKMMRRGGISMRKALYKHATDRMRSRGRSREGRR